MSALLRKDDNVARELGLQRASGLEVSLTGDVLTNLRVTAAMLWGDIKVIGPDLRAEGVGTVAFNQTRILSSINASYQLPRLPAVSADISVFSFGRYPASLDDVAQGAAGTLINLGGRYRFTIAGAPATLRLQIQNLTNLYFWNLGFGGPGFSQYQPRAVFGYLTADFWCLDVDPSGTRKERVDGPPHKDVEFLTLTRYLDLLLCLTSS
jgi:iron complex outermembrane receptor protein